jgi:hypothetical protein
LPRKSRVNQALDQLRLVIPTFLPFRSSGVLIGLFSGTKRPSPPIWGSMSSEDATTSFAATPLSRTLMK